MLQIPNLLWRRLVASTLTLLYVFILLGSAPQLTRAESNDTLTPPATPTTEEIETAEVAPSSLDDTDSVESVTATAESEENTSTPWVLVGIAVATLGLLAIVYLSRNKLGRRQSIAIGLFVALLGGIGILVIYQTRPQADSVANTFAATINLVRMKDGSYRCEITGQSAVTNSTTTDALKIQLQKANLDAQRSSLIRTRLKTNIAQARSAGLQLAKRKAQLLALAEADPGAAKELVLSEKDLTGLSQFGNCVESPTILTGTVETQIMESFIPGSEDLATQELNSLASDDGERFSLHSDDTIGLGEQQVQGYQLDSEVLVTASDERKNGVWGSGPSPMAAVGSGEQRTLFVPVNFLDTRGQPYPLPTDHTAEEMASMFFGEIAEYYRQSSNNNLQISGDVSDEIIINQNPLTTIPGASGMYAFQEKILTEIIKQTEFDLNSYDKLIIFAPTAWSGVSQYDPYVHWDGFGTIGDTSRLIDSNEDGVLEKISIGITALTKTHTESTSPGRTKFVLAHEFGHTLGAHHANLYGCHDMRTDCIATNPVGASEYWTSAEYANRFGMMGNPILYETGEMLDDPAPLKDIRGWYAGNDVREIRTSGEYTLRPFEGTSTNEPIVLRIPRDRDDDAQGFLYIEYRQDPRITNLYPEVGQGALLNFTNTNAFHSDLIVPDPSIWIKERLFGSTFSQATLTTDDAPFIDSESGITVDILSSGPDSLRVSIALGESSADSLPIRVIGPTDQTVTQVTPSLEFIIDRYDQLNQNHFIVEITNTAGQILTYDSRVSLTGWSGMIQNQPYFSGSNIPVTFTPPALPPGMYSWRVKAIARQPVEDNVPFVYEGEFTEAQTFEITSPSYFLFQVQSPYGPASSTVARVESGEGVRVAREALAGGPGAHPYGPLQKTSNAQNPTWSWSWDQASFDVTTQTNTACSGDPIALELNLTNWVSSDFCPNDMYVTQEIGASLPTKTYQLALAKNTWSYAEIPGANMRLAGDDAAGITNGKLLIFVFRDGVYQKITDPLYTFKTGEGYMLLNTESTTLDFSGDKTYSDTLHLKQGWNLVSIPGDVKRSLASVYTKSRTYQTPTAAVQSRVLYGFASTDSGSVALQSLSDTTQFENKAIWIYAYEEAVMHFRAQ